MLRELARTEEDVEEDDLARSDTSKTETNVGEMPASQPGVAETEQSKGIRELEDGGLCVREGGGGRHGKKGSLMDENNTCTSRYRLCVRPHSSLISTVSTPSSHPGSQSWHFFAIQA